ncbi:MAG TPA: carbamoyltransferase C-terminal domain-containing protein [Syntrophorhabdaceae bacterium]|jgi:carbamoyltransferase
MVILGLNAYHGDSSACILADGVLLAAAEEERFKRIKHWAGFPTQAIKYCLGSAGIRIDEVDHIAINRRPSAHMLKKALFAFSRRPGLGAIKNRLTNASKVYDIASVLCSEFYIQNSKLRAEIHNVEHHLAHLASSFFVAPFDSAAVVSVDGFGDFVSTMWGIGDGNRIVVNDQVSFPHSLGLFYLAMTQFLGFPYYGDEYKVMGLAPYGKPSEMNKMKEMVQLRPEGRFELCLDYFVHHSEGISMVWEKGEPTIGTVFSDKLIDLLGPPRRKDSPISEYHKNLGASLQQMYEDAFFHLLNHVYEKTGNRTLCLSGGCAMNSVANGKVFNRSPFKDMYIQSAAGDAGGAIGAAFHVWNQELGKPRSFVMEHAYFGPEFGNKEIMCELDNASSEIKREGCEVTLVEDEEALCREVAQRVAEGKIVGWFQGRMEWGPRALGNRSIVCDPRRPNIKDILNVKIKRRESFRPFAPSIIREAVAEWFETDYDVPFMLQVYQIREPKRNFIPAVTHVNGSGRLQSVTEDQNPRYYRLIKAFEAITHVPMVLNTSFNENEPVVCTPKEALDCFLRTKMDVLVLNNYFVERDAV